MDIRYKLSLLAIVIAVLALVSACGGESSSDGEGRKVPARTNILFGIRLGDILGDPDLTDLANSVITPLGENAALDQALDEIIEETGFDPRAVMDALLFGDVESDEYFGIFIEGSIDQDSLLSALETDQGPLVKEEYKGQELYTAPDGEVSLVILDPGKILIGSPDTVRDTIDVMEGEAEALVGSLLGDFENLGEPLVRMSITIPAGTLSEEGLLDEVPFPGFNLDLFTEVQTIGLTFDKEGETLSFSVALGYPDEESAAGVVEAFDGLVTVFGAFSDDPELASLLDEVEISASGLSATISYDATIGELTAALESLGELGPDLLSGDLFGGLLGEEAIPAPIAVPRLLIPDELYFSASSVSGQFHVPAGTRVSPSPYTSDPPTSGPHWSQAGVAPIAWGIYSQPIADEILVHNLEHGGIVIYYRTSAEADIVIQLSGFVRSQPFGVTGLILVPRDNLPATIVLSAWEYNLPLHSYDEDAMNVFIRAHYDNGPEALGGGQ